MFAVEKAFGGRKELGIETRRFADFEELIKKGIPVSAGAILKRRLGLNDKDFATAIGSSTSTLARKKKGGRFSFTESDRLYRFARIYAFAVDVFGGEEDARQWLSTPQIALDYRTPISVMATEAGAREVENLLGRIMHGIAL